MSNPVHHKTYVCLYLISIGGKCLPITSLIGLIHSIPFSYKVAPLSLRHFCILELNKIMICVHPRYSNQPRQIFDFYLLHYTEVPLFPRGRGMCVAHLYFRS